jgi:hypothetical protein
VISDPLVLIFLMVGTAIAIAAFIVEARWPDPDLANPWDPNGPMCKCGVRDGARHHIHPTWTERGPR